MSITYSLCHAFSVFLEFGPASTDTLQLAFNFGVGSASTVRTWDIKVEQIKCTETDEKK